LTDDAANIGAAALGLQTDSNFDLSVEVNKLGLEVTLSSKGSKHYSQVGSQLVLLSG
jgi:hypothetical protein